MEEDSSDDFLSTMTSSVVFYLIESSQKEAIMCVALIMNFS